MTSTNAESSEPTSMSLIAVVSPEAAAISDEAWDDHRDILERLHALSPQLCDKFDYAIAYPANQPATLCKIAEYQALVWRMNSWLSPDRSTILQAAALMDQLASRYPASDRIVLHFNIAVSDAHDPEFYRCTLPMRNWLVQQPFTSGFGILRDWVKEDAFQTLVEIVNGPHPQELLSALGPFSTGVAMKWLYDRCNDIGESQEFMRQTRA
jgi:hypothetical protein